MQMIKIPLLLKEINDMNSEKQLKTHKNQPKYQS